MIALEAEFLRGALKLLLVLEHLRAATRDGVLALLDDPMREMQPPGLERNRQPARLTPTALLQELEHSSPPIYLGFDFNLKQ